MSTNGKVVRGRPFQSGDDPRRNTNGRPAGSRNAATLLHEAIDAHREASGDCLYEHLVRRCFESDRVLSAALPYLLPRLTPDPAHSLQEHINTVQIYMPENGRDSTPIATETEELPGPL